MNVVIYEPFLFRHITDGQPYRLMEHRIRELPAQEYLAHKKVRCMSYGERGAFSRVVCFILGQVCVPPGSCIHGTTCDVQETLDEEMDGGFLAFVDESCVLPVIQISSRIASSTAALKAGICELRMASVIKSVFSSQTEYSCLFVAESDAAVCNLQFS